MLLNREFDCRVNGISVTPLIDVVFILLLFFLLTSNFSRSQQIDIQSAGASKRVDPSEQQSVALLIGTQDVWINSDQMSPDSLVLKQELRQISEQQTSVLIAAVAEVSVQQLVTWIDLLNELGIKKVKLAKSVTQEPLDVAK
jgi:biopolymer transport protein ExbD